MTTNWYTFTTSTELKIVGDYPQTDGMKLDYDLRKPTSVWNLPNCSFPDFEPDLDYFLLTKKAKLTDIVSTALINAAGFIVSEKVKNILSEFRLPEHKYFSAKLKYKNQIYSNYYWLHFGSDNAALIDFNNSTFVRRDPILTFNDDMEELVISNVSDLDNESRKDTVESIFPTSLQVNNQDGYDFLYFNDFWNNFFIKGTLLEKLLENNCTGCDYKKTSFQLTESF